MNYPIFIKVLGILLTIEGIGMILPLFISLYYDSSDSLAFIISIILNLFIGFIMYKIPVIKHEIKIKEAFGIVSIGWVLISVFGALPFVIYKSVPSFIDGFFEMVSGFTTTGSTIINNFASLPPGILFWRTFSHWIGGMGILVFTVAVLPALGIGSYYIFRAEIPGPIKDRIVPRIKDTAKILYLTYIGMTLVEIVLLKIGGMGLYDAIIHTFGTIGTGGLSTRNESIASFNSNFITIVITIFMVLSAINFSTYHQLLKGNWKKFFKNEELRFFLFILITSTIFITINLGGNFLNTLKNALFQTSSIMSTTNFTIQDYTKWPVFSKSILIMLMFLGGCAGSISGGIKNIRILVLLKLIKREITKIFHPRAVIPIKINGKSLSSDEITSIMSFFVLYIVIISLGTIVISIEGFDLITSSSAIIASLGNIGPGFGLVGPTQNYGQFSNFSKIFLSFLMLLGRLELFSVLMLFNPKFWTDSI